MKNILAISNILKHNDYPEIFIASDHFDREYICLLVEVKEDELSYIATIISETRIFDFLNGKIDLREIFEFPEFRAWYFIENLNESINPKLWNGNSMPAEYLPERGFLINNQL